MRRGDFVLLLGPNGSGKTTLLRLLSGYAAPTRGRLRWNGDGDPRRRLAAESLRRGIGFAGHHPLLYEELTARENLTFLLRLHAAPDPDAACQRWLEAFGLADRADERVASLSRGLKQRLALARAFAVDPRLLLLDEPGEALDADGSRRLLMALEEVRGRAAVVLATHHPEPFRPLAGRVLEIRQGRLHEEGGAP